MAAVLDEAVAAVDLAAEPTTIDLSDALVEGIARQIRSDGFAVVDGALGDAHAAALRSSCLAVDKAASTIAEGTKMTVDGKRRDDVVAWLKKSDDAAVAAHRAAMDALRAKLEAALALKMDSSSFMTAQYAAGSAGYVRHRDSAPRRPSGRKLTAIYYLNPAWTAADGGELRIWPDSCAEAYVGGARDDAGPHRDLAPRHDRLLVFRSALEHAVTTVARGPPGLDDVVLQQARARPRAHRREARPAAGARGRVRVRARLRLPRRLRRGRRARGDVRRRGPVAA